jgi:hypothetical protein
MHSSDNPQRDDVPDKGIKAEKSTLLQPCIYSVTCYSSFSANCVIPVLPDNVIVKLCFGLAIVLEHTISFQKCRVLSHNQRVGKAIDDQRSTTKDRQGLPRPCLSGEEAVNRMIGCF